jgi:hypothetical protein
MATGAMVRRMCFTDRPSLPEISRRKNLSRNTIKKWLNPSDGTELK